MGKKLKKEKFFDLSKYQDVEDTITIEPEEISAEKASVAINPESDIDSKLKRPKSALTIEGTFLTALADLACMIEFGKTAEDKLDEVFAERAKQKSEEANESEISADAAQVAVAPNTEPTIIDGSFVNLVSSILAPWLLKPTEEKTA